MIAMLLVAAAVALAALVGLIVWSRRPPPELRGNWWPEFERELNAYQHASSGRAQPRPGQPRLDQRRGRNAPGAGPGPRWTKGGSPSGVARRAASGGVQATGVASSVRASTPRHSRIGGRSATATAATSPSAHGRR